MAPGKPAPKRMLIIEDEDAMADALSHRFGRQGFAVTVAHDGQEGIAALEKDPFDIVLLDLVMPQKNGFEVLTEVPRTQNAKTPIFVLTNYGQEENIKRATSLGAIRCYVKSHTSLREISDEIAKVVGK